MYQVLARKYRPQTFEEVVGQEHVTTTLRNAIRQDRLHHAYVFSGVRGTGKTSLARIFAKCLNCEKGPTAKPCNQCSHCVEINKGNFLDVLEIDGASNTSVDNVRELREQVKYLPAAGKYKVYIIDEVHMLSTSAFNALLKTLEEPPPHVVFIFATTEIHKIPVTILSRCQRFDLRRLSHEQVAERLRHMCQQEGVKPDEASIELLARSSEGSLRDGQSLLDMAIGMCGDQLKLQPIQEMLGLVQSTWIEELTRDCLSGDLSAALKKVEEIYHRGLDLRQVAMQWTDYLHDLTLLKAAGPKALGTGVSADQIKVMEGTVASVELDTLQVSFQTVYRAAEQIFRSDHPKILFDLLLVRLVHGAPYQSIASLLGGELPSASPVRVQPRSFSESSNPSRTTVAEKKTVPPATKSLKTSSVASSPNPELLTRALRKRPQIKALLEHALEQRWEGERFIVSFHRGDFWVEMFQDKRSALAESLSEAAGKEIKVVIEEVEKTSDDPSLSSESETPPIPEDPVVKQAVEILNATVKEVKKL